MALDAAETETGQQQVTTVVETGANESREHAPLSTLLALERIIAQRAVQAGSAGARKPFIYAHVFCRSILSVILSALQGLFPH